jgi:hypothetical protein
MRITLSILSRILGFMPFFADGPVGGGAPADDTTQPVVTPPAVPAAPSVDLLDLTKTPEPPVVAPVVESFEATGDPALDLALEFFAAKGIGADHKAMAAAIKGDFSLLEATLAVMGDKAKGFERMLAISKSSYAKAQETVTAKVAAAKKDIVEAVGGEDKWKEIYGWASTAGTEQDRAEASTALRAGGVQAKAMALYLKSIYDQGAEVKTPTNVASDTATGRAPAEPPMTASRYAQEVNALRTTLGANFDNSAQYQALQARRAAARQRGI